MNSALQCLSNIPEFTQKILSFNDQLNVPIIGVYSALIKTIWSGKYVVTTPSSLLLNIRENIPRFTQYRQQDAQELMNYFLHLIYDTYSDAKIDTYIDFPLRDLNLSQYITQIDGKKTNISALYDLVAVSNHTGTLVSGHYITYARNDRNKRWYSFNGEITQEIRDEKDIVTKNAYILVS
jgi:ubiquitin C-terminal hydrolase